MNCYAIFRHLDNHNAPLALVGFVGRLLPITDSQTGQVQVKGARRLAQRLGVSVASVKRYRRQLVSLGVLSVDQEGVSHLTPPGITHDTPPRVIPDTRGVTSDPPPVSPMIPPPAPPYKESAFFSTSTPPSPPGGVTPIPDPDLSTLVEGVVAAPSPDTTPDRDPERGETHPGVKTSGRKGVLEGRGGDGPEAEDHLGASWRSAIDANSDLDTKRWGALPHPIRDRLTRASPDRRDEVWVGLLSVTSNPYNWALAVLKRPEVRKSIPACHQPSTLAPMSPARRPVDPAFSAKLLAALDAVPDSPPRPVARQVTP